jgi:signal transduction histidine kinase
LAFWGGVAIVGTLGYSRLVAVDKVSHFLLDKAIPAARSALQVENAIHEVLENTYLYCTYRQPDHRAGALEALSEAEQAFVLSRLRGTGASDETFNRIGELIEIFRRQAVDCLQMTDNRMTAEAIRPHLDDLGSTQVEIALQLRKVATVEQAEMVRGAEEIGAAIDKGIEFLIGGTLVLLVVTLAIGFWLSRMVLQPVRALTMTALRFSTEDLTVRASEEFAGEFAVLGRAFNTMASRIQETHEENVHLAAFPRENPGLILESNSTGEVTYVNPAARHVLRQLGIKVAADFLPVEHERIVRSSLESGESRIHVDVMVGERMFSWSYHPISAAGSVHVYGMDITELKKTEEERRGFERQLIQAERMAAVGTVTAGIVHNLKNPLTGVMGFAEILKIKNPDLWEVDQIVSSAQQMSEMIENILAKSRQKKTTESVDLNVLLEHELEFLQADTTFKTKVKQDIRLAAELQPVQGAYTEFSQVFGNLLRNSVDAMLEQETKLLTVVTSSDADQVTVEVTDTGYGIPEDVLPHLFEPFFTTKSPEAEGDGPVGTGLGLYMVQQILQSYGGKVEVESVVDEGTTFKIVIPVNSTDDAR